MQQFFNNRYVQLTGLTIGLSLVFFLLIWFVAQMIGLQDFPVMLEVMLSVLGAGILVYKVFSERIV